MVLKLLTSLISPPYCVQCSAFLKKRTHLCSACFEELAPITSCALDVTEKYQVPVYALTTYDGVVRSLILAKQYGQRLASVQLGDLMVQRIVCPWEQYDVLVPVPLHWTRYAVRGFNQSAVIARRLSKAWKLPVDRNVYRAVRTSYQTSCDRNERLVNVTQAFALSTKAKASLQGKRVLLVDDVMTTGATLREVARVVAQCSPAAIGAVVAARA